jgi:hypothetical protein
MLGQRLRTLPPNHPSQSLQRGFKRITVGFIDCIAWPVLGGTQDLYARHVGGATRKPALHYIKPLGDVEGALSADGAEVTGRVIIGARHLSDRQPMSARRNGKSEPFVDTLVLQRPNAGDEFALTGGRAPVAGRAV